MARVDDTISIVRSETLNVNPRRVGTKKKMRLKRVQMNEKEEQNAATREDILSTYGSTHSATHRGQTSANHSVLVHAPAVDVLA